MDVLITQLKNAAIKADATGRKKVIDTLRELTYSLESSEDTMQRIMFLNLQIASVRIGINLKLFETLAGSVDPMTLDQLIAKTGADSVLLGRLLRYLASIGIIKETVKDTFTSTNITKTLAIPGYQGGIHHYFDTVGPMYQKLPDFLEETKYQNITDNMHTVLQPAWKTDVPAFIWFQQNPQRFEYFNQYMTTQRQGLPTWLSVYPVSEETKGWSPEKPVFVDVGGGFGHQCAALRAHYPELPGRIILQDLPHATEHAIAMENVEVMVHDFFQPQPIKEAKFYYLRNILHDYPNDKCVTILNNLKDAMGKDSLILIDDMVLPDSQVHWQATQLDLTMMCALASMERTAEQWKALLDAAGLKAQKVYPYIELVQDSILVAIPK